MLVRASRMAASMAGKIWSPLSSTSTRLPPTIGGPEQHAHRAPELRIGGGVEAPDSLPDSLLAMSEIQSDDRRREGNAGRGERNERQPGFHPN